MELFAATEWYKQCHEPEVRLHGRIERRTAIGGPNERLGLLYCLKTESGALPIYTGAENDALKPYLRRVVTVIGKIIDVSMDGSRELWIAHIL